MYQGYLSIHGTEVFNNNRVTSYLSNGLAQSSMSVKGAICGCEYIGTGPYVTPSFDDAPWYDPSNPDSALFAGMFVESIEGFDSPWGQAGRTAVDSAILGGSLGPLRPGLRTITITGWLFGKTCCATQYGLGWITQALRNGACKPPEPIADCDDVCEWVQACIDAQDRDQCGGLGTMEFYACCPTILDDPCHELEVDETLIDHKRFMCRVGLINGPVVLNRFGSCCASCGNTAIQVQYTLAAEVPYIYQAPFEICDVTIDVNNVYECEYACCDEDEPSPCLSNFTVPKLNTTLTGNCFCEPWGTVRGCCTLENTSYSEEIVTQIFVYAGGGEIRNLRIAAYELPDSVDDCDCDFFVGDNFSLAECQWKVGEALIPWIPASGWITLDGACRKVEFTWRGQTSNGARYVSGGTSGRPTDKFPVANPCKKLCIVAYADPNNTPAGLQMIVRGVRRGLVLA